MTVTAENRLRERRSERLAIIFLAAIVAPVLAVITVAGYGFCVWMTQLISGPPH
jgi:nitrate reductase NapE